MDPMTPAVPSPCTEACRLDAAANACLSCLRTRSEIAHWPRYREFIKKTVLRQALGRAVYEAGTYRLVYPRGCYQCAVMLSDGEGTREFFPAVSFDAATRLVDDLAASEATKYFEHTIFNLHEVVPVANSN